MSDYHPIECGLHSEYELAIMRGQRVRLSWSDEAGENYTEVLIPLDLIARQGEEFLRVQGIDGGSGAGPDAGRGGEKRDIRLDRISAFSPLR